MGAKSAAAFVLAIAGLVPAGTAGAETGAFDDPAAARVRASFKVDGIALFDAHDLHAKRIGVCAASVFAGLKWCVSGTIEEKRDEIAYAKTTGYNIDGDGRIVYAIATRRGYPLKRAAFDGVVRTIGERYGAGATVLAFKKPAEEGAAAQSAGAQIAGVDSLIAVWGGVRLVQLSEAEYALVEGGNSLKRGHLIDHRFNLVISAKQRDPVYKIEGEAGFILQLNATLPDRADVIARAVYPPVFLPPPAKPGAEAAHPLVTETVRRAPRAAAAEHTPDRAKGRDTRIDAAPGLAAERLLREQAERRAAEEKEVRGEVERMMAGERRAFERERRRLEAARRAAEERAGRAEAALKAGTERRGADEAARKPAEGAARRADPERAEDERKAAAEKGADERSKADEGTRAAERKPEPEPAAPERAAPERAAPSDGGQRAAAADPAGIVWTFSETQVRVADERTLRAQAFFGGAGEAARLAVEVTFECRIIGRDRRLRAYARGIDRASAAGVAFRTAGEDSFGVRTRFALDGQAPQSGLLFREHQDDIASFLELPVTAADRAKETLRAAIWLGHAAVAIDFPLATGTVAAVVAPKADNLRRVLEACAQ